MHDTTLTDADLDALFRQAAEMAQKRYESTLWLSAEPTQQDAVQVSMGERMLTGDALPALNGRNLKQSTP